MTIPGPSIFTDLINVYLPEPQASLLNGIIFGVPLKTSADFYAQLKAVGLLHMVVLSGMNITLLSSIIMKLTASISNKISILITVLIVIFFILFVGIQAPIVRAGFMSILTFVSILYGRKAMALYSLFLSFIFVALVWPQWIPTLSLQLSYAATLGLILFGKKANPTRGNKIILYLKDEFYTSMAAQIFTAPLIFWHFKQISLISPLSNIAVSWLIAPLMIFGLLTAFLGKIHIVLGIIPAYICYGILSFMVWTIEFFSQIPFAFMQFN